MLGTRHFLYRTYLSAEVLSYVNRVEFVDNSRLKIDSTHFECVSVLTFFIYIILTDEKTLNMLTQLAYISI